VFPANPISYGQLKYLTDSAVESGGHYEAPKEYPSEKQQAFTESELQYGGPTDHEMGQTVQTEILT